MMTGYTPKTISGMMTGRGFLGNLTGSDHLYGFILPEQAHSSEKTEHKTYLEEGRTLG
jgi:hypothetical protein